MSNFQELSDEEQKLFLSVLQERIYRDGEIICQEGESGSSCYILIEGMVEVVKNIPGENKKQVIANLEPEALFGQISLIDGRRRSATCRAVGKVTVFELERKDFDCMFENESVLAFKIQDEIAKAVGHQVLKACQILRSLLSRDMTDSFTTIDD